MPTTMLPIETLITFTLASIAIVVVPGPTVTVIIANSLRHGAKAGLSNIAGTQLGLAMMLAVLAVGLSAIVSAMAWIFDILRLVGAAYLIWLGIRLWRSSMAALPPQPETVPLVPGPGKSFFWEGLLVIWSNPKALLFFGAFIPQFVDPQGPALAQTLLLGLIFMAVATVFDGAYALAAGRAGRWLTGRRMQILERISGSFLIGGGLWLAFGRRS
jgi:threonine/homoserine/homoserine lactone efflux protein